jgi:AcrR family transcriptional regulator
MMTDTIKEVLIEARRDQILKAASKVFATKGFHSTTIRDIAKEAGIADGTIYNYFENKTALLFGILDLLTAYGRKEASLLDLDPTDMRAFLRAYLRLPLMALRADDFGLFRVLVSEIVVNPFLRAEYYRRVQEPTLQTARPLLQQWAAQQKIKPLNIDLALRAISGLMLGLIMTHLMGDPTLETQWEALPDFMADLILEGLRSNPA